LDFVVQQWPNRMCILQKYMMLIQPGR
jgi:hypothetical protein